MLWLLRRGQWDKWQRLVRFKWSPAWLLLRPLHCMDISTDPMGHSIFLFWQHDHNFTLTSGYGLGSKTLYILYQVCSICSLFHTKVRCKVLSFFLSVAALSLKRKCPLRCLRILCELKIDQRQRIESWELQTIFLTLFTSSGSQLLTFLHRLCPASPAHTLTDHKALSNTFPGLLKQQQVLSHSLEDTEIEMEPRSPQGSSHDSTKSIQSINHRRWWEVLAPCYPQWASPRTVSMTTDKPGSMEPEI